jgi:hypothetical protein
MKTVDGTGLRSLQPPSPSVTGRDSHIVGQALYWFIREQQTLPEEQFEWSNVEDAKLILLKLFPSIAEHFAQDDQRAGRTLPTPSPAGALSYPFVEGNHRR